MLNNMPYFWLIGSLISLVSALYIVLHDFYLWKKNLPRKKRRRLEAQREMIENEREDNDDNQVFIL